MSEVSEQGRGNVVYTAYGFDAGGESRIGFNGELKDSFSGQYFLGKGYRMFDPLVMRFKSPDGVGWSPFGAGGINPYAYVEGNPVKFKDSTGHVRGLARGLVRVIDPDFATRSAPELGLTTKDFSQYDPDLAGWYAYSGPPMQRSGRNVNAGSEVAAPARTKPDTSTKRPIAMSSRGDGNATGVQNAAPQAQQKSVSVERPIKDVRPAEIGPKPGPSSKSTQPSKPPTAVRPKTLEITPNPNSAEIQRLDGKIREMRNQRHHYMVDENQIAKWLARIAELRQS
ncbi:hypothetical protein K9857_20020 [Pseudomonas sp. REP124]|uniref:RHS repeat-associated core domain-containing protein n=1 Tax=Pseudomonas sp. REP124 TaxID=2875731 RepID=UPI001CCB4492|nr:RHS repeat-associated core domain-containing protein [Pseudomonas sp. REP124]MBZ9783824.1 hypothetical protein [Pseudomonas sp. REP124]